MTDVGKEGGREVRPQTKRKEKMSGLRKGLLVCGEKVDIDMPIASAGPWGAAAATQLR